MNLIDKITVIDVETGGLNPDTDAVLQVALVSSTHELDVRVLDVWGARHLRAMEVNGIVWEEHAKIATYIEVSADLVATFLRRGPPPIIAGHNIGFDVAFVRRLFRLAGQESPVSWYRTLDTHTMLLERASRGLIPLECTSLDRALDLFDIEVKDRHTALGDARATYKLIKRLLETA